jgi:hypothetical protein
VQTSSSLAAFRALYGKAAVEVIFEYSLQQSYASHKYFQRVEELNFRSEDLNLEGFISLSGSHSRVSKCT